MKPKPPRRRIAVVGLPILQSVHNLSSTAIASYSERQGNWQFVFAAEATVEALNFLRSQDCDGAIVRLLSPAMKRAAQRLSIPVINVSSWLEEPGVPTVRHDYRTCGRIAATYLLDKGFRQFGYVTMPGGCVPRRAALFLEEIRARGFEARQFHLPIPQPFLRRPLDASERKRFISWLNVFTPPAALVFMDDWYAPALMRLCLEAGLEIPRDLAVLSIGIHNETLAACPVPLTAIQENHEAQMERVVARLEAMMAGRSFRDRIVEIPPAGIVERGSTAFTAVEDRTVAHAMDYIRGHLAEGISIPRLAEKLEISRATLDRRFQKEAGETPHDFLANERIKMAQELLRAGPEASLEAISRACGFSDRRRFNLVFKQAVGQPPAAWRAAQKPRDA